MDRYICAGFSGEGLNLHKNDKVGDWVKYEEVKLLEAENKRYREALKEICLDTSYGYYDDSDTPNCNNCNFNNLCNLQEE